MISVVKKLERLEELTVVRGSTDYSDSRSASPFTGKVLRIMRLLKRSSLPEEEPENF